MAGVSGLIRDITERKQMEEKMLLSQKLADMGKSAAGMAHENNSPLQVDSNFKVVTEL